MSTSNEIHISHLYGWGTRTKIYFYISTINNVFESI